MLVLVPFRLSRRELVENSRVGCARRPWSRTTRVHCTHYSAILSVPVVLRAGPCTPIFSLPRPGGANSGQRSSSLSSWEELASSGASAPSPIGGPPFKLARASPHCMCSTAGGSTIYRRETLGREVVPCLNFLPTRTIFLIIAIPFDPPRVSSSREALLWRIPSSPFPFSAITVLYSTASERCRTERFSPSLPLLRLIPLPPVQQARGDLLAPYFNYTKTQCGRNT